MAVKKENDFDLTETSEGYSGADLQEWDDESLAVTGDSKKTAAKTKFERAARVASQDFFGGGKRQEILDLVLYLISYTYPVVVLSGAKGVGKSCLGKQVLKFAPESNCRAVSFDGAVLLQSQDFPLYIAQTIGVPKEWFESDGQLVDAEKAILDFAEQSAFRGESIILCIDNAEQLTVSIANTLLRWVGVSHEQQLKVILLGDFSTSSLFEEEAIAEKFAALGHWIALEPFDEKDAEHFLKFLLKSKGVRDYSALTTMKESIKKAKGYPDELIMQLDAVLAAGAKKSTEQVEVSGFSRFHFLVGAVAIFLIGLAWVFDGNPKKDDFDTLDPAVAEAASRKASLPNSDPFHREALASRLDKEGAGSANIEAGYISQSKPLSSPSLPGKPSSQQIASASEIPDIVESVPVASNFIIEESVNADITAGSRTAGVLTEEAVEVSDPSLVAEPLLDGEPGVSLSTREFNESTSLQQKQKSLNVVKLRAVEARPLAKPVVAKKQIPEKPVTKAISGIGQVVWLGGASSNHFTLQVFAGRDKAAAAAFVKANQASGRLDYFKYSHLGQPWYAVVYGDFPSRAAAQKAALRLPGSLKGKQPWVRSIGDVQKIIIK